MELCEKRKDVKRDIIGFRASLKGLRRDAVQLSLGKGVVYKAFCGTVSPQL